MVETVYTSDASVSTSLRGFSGNLHPSVSGIPSTRPRSRGQIVQKTTVLLPPVTIMNVPFQVRRGGELYIFESNAWSSLRAFGVSFAEAYTETIKLLQVAFKEYVLVDENILAEDAKDLRRYLIDRMFSATE